MSRKNKNAQYRGRSLKKQVHAKYVAERKFEKFVKQFFDQKGDGRNDSH